LDLEKQNEAFEARARQLKGDDDILQSTNKALISTVEKLTAGIQRLKTESSEKDKLISQAL